MLAVMLRDRNHPRPRILDNDELLSGGAERNGKLKRDGARVLDNRPLLSVEKGTREEANCQPQALASSHRQRQMQRTSLLELETHTG